MLYTKYVQSLFKGKATQDIIYKTIKYMNGH